METNINHGIRHYWAIKLVGCIVFIGDKANIPITPIIMLEVRLKSLVLRVVQVIYTWQLAPATKYLGYI